MQNFPIDGLLTAFRGFQINGLAGVFFDLRVCSNSGVKLRTQIRYNFWLRLCNGSAFLREGETRKPFNRVGNKQNQKVKAMNEKKKKHKLNLDELKVQSFVTSFNISEGETAEIKGGCTDFAGCTNNKTDWACMPGEEQEPGG